MNEKNILFKQKCTQKKNCIGLTIKQEETVFIVKPRGCILKVKWFITILLFLC